MQAGMMGQMMGTSNRERHLVPENDRERNLLSVAVEVQRLIENMGYKPQPLEKLNQMLSMGSHRILMENHMGIFAVCEQYPQLLQTTFLEDGKQYLVACCGFPWLGEGPASPSFKGPTHFLVNSHAASKEKSTSMRKKTSEVVTELTKLPWMQSLLTEVATHILASPTRMLLVSQLGSLMTAESRSVLKSRKLRIAQVLSRFPTAFQMHSSGPGVAVTYLHPLPLAHHEPSSQTDDISCSSMSADSMAACGDRTSVNTTRLCMLLKLSADAASPCTAATPITVRELLNESYVLVDCRSTEERSASILPGSISLEGLTSDHLQDYDLVVYYCCIGAQSARMCQQLQEEKHPYASRVRYLAGGIASWCHHGGQLVDPRRPRQQSYRVHCLVEELKRFFPMQGSGYEVSAYPPLSDQTDIDEALRMLLAISRIRHSRVCSLAWKVRLRYWPLLFGLEAEEMLSDIKTQRYKLLMVDCRGKEERLVSTLDVGHPIGLCSLEEFKQNPESMLDHFDKVVGFCTLGGRSGNAFMEIIDTLAERGFAKSVLVHKMVNLLGGIICWLHVGGRLVDARGAPTNRIHPWCLAFIDFFPLVNLDVVFVENAPVPQDAAAFSACQDVNETVSNKVMQICTSIPPEILNDSLTKAMASCEIYED